VRLTVLGSCGAWPEAGRACSGYLVEHDGFRLLVELGYAVLPRLQEHIGVDEVDAVLISHGHPDHCADLNPLLRARVLRDDPFPPLPVYALPGALDAVLALDRPGMLNSGYVVHDLTGDGRLELGPFQVQVRSLPHSMPNTGFRLAAGRQAFAYTGDCGPSPAMVELARGTDLLLAEASHVDHVAEDTRNHLSSAIQRGREAAEADTGRLVLTHLMPGTDPAAAVSAATSMYDGDVVLATAGLVLNIV
jgi:ribonuclease BN (tRNA processing enzyme)